MSSLKKIFLLITIVALTFAYSFYQNSLIKPLENYRTELILKILPDISLINIKNEKTVSSKEILMEKKDGIVVHFWGTWCAPCELEFPSFINFATKLESKNVLFLAIAINDDIKSVKKYIKKKKLKLPSNFRVYIPKTKNILSYFGTAKVPESFVFNSRGIHEIKYIGSQDWNSTTIYEEIVKKISSK